MSCGPYEAGTETCEAAALTPGGGICTGRRGSGTGVMTGDVADLRTSGAAATWPRFERPSTDVVRPRSARGSRARVAGAKNADPSGALKARSFVPNARPTAAEEPESRTSVRLAATETPRSERARAQRRTALTVARDGAKRRLKPAGVSPWPLAAAR